MGHEGHGGVIEKGNEGHPHAGRHEGNAKEGAAGLKETGGSPGIGTGTLLTVLLAGLVLVSAFNQYQIAALYALPIPTKVVTVGSAAGSGTGNSGLGAGTGSTGTQTQTQTLDILPKGIPAVYGSELGVRYDDISADNAALADQTIEKLSGYDRELSLSGAELDRYKKIGTSIACEYCCGATSLIFANGQPACGCAHSYAMRGLAKYLLKNHGSEYTDEQILEELGKWKVLFFPGVHAKKASVLQDKGIELSYINLASNKYRGAEKGASGGSGAMVGGC